MNLHIPFEKAKRYLVVLGLLIVALAVATFVYWSASASDVIEIKNVDKSGQIPVRTIREHPTANGVVILQVEYCKHVSVDGRQRISFVSSSDEEFLPISTERSEATCQQQEVPVLIPDDISPGEYRVKFRIEYQVNPIKKVIEEFSSEPFQVVRP